MSPNYYSALVHTESGDVDVECREVALALQLDFALANVLKYLWRAGRKTESPLEDLKKAANYLLWEIEQIGRTS